MFLTGFTSCSVLLLLIYRSSCLSLFTVSDAISYNADEILLISPSANVFVFPEFNIHQKNWPTYYGRTDRPGELCYHFFNLK